jgi:thioesterase domain-containing protein/acyl carrier protein
MTLQIGTVSTRQESRKAAPASEPALFPCTPPQERCWFLEKLQPGNTALNVAVRWEIRGEVATSSIERAFRTIVARHEVLRTKLVDVNGTPMQQALDHADFELSVVDLRQLPEAEQAPRAAALGLAEAKAPFDLGHAPLIRATAMRTAHDCTLLLVVVHQAVFDGWSIRVLGSEVGQAIAAYEAQRVPELEELPLQYGDYALWQQEYFKCAGFETEKAYWRNQLAGVPYFELATDRPRQARRTPNGSLISTTLSVEAGERLEAAAKAHGVSLFNFGCAAVAAILHRVSGETDIVFGTQVAGRDEVDLEALIGVFINNLVLRIDASGDPTFRDFLSRAETVVHGALAHQKLPFHKLVELQNPARDLARTPLISINVILQRAFLENAHYDTFELVGVPSPSPGAFYDLNFQMVGRPEGWRMSVEYNTDLFAQATAEDILHGWKAALEAASANSDLRLSVLPAPGPRRKRARWTDGPFADLEQLLASQPDVAGAVVVGVDDAHGSQRAYAYVEPAADTRTPLEALPAALLARVRQSYRDSQKLIGVSVLLQLPRDAGGRIDATALPPRPSAPAALNGTSSQPMLTAPSASRALEQKVAKIWAEALGVATIEPESDFFELGGHSLLAVRMLTRVEKTFGQHFDISILFTAPQLRAFVNALVKAGLNDVSDADAQPARSDDDNDSWKIVTLQDKGSSAPIIAINNLGTLYALSQRLGDSRPAFCVRTFDPSQPPQAYPPKRFEDIAADYVALIRRAQPHGPYVLLGLCVHGVLAVEIAHQLRAAGEAVSLVAVMNCWEPGYVASMSGYLRWSLRFHDVGKHVLQLARGRTTPLAFLGTYRIVHRSGALDLARRLGMIEAIPPRTGSSDADAFLLYLHRSRDQYRPNSYDGDVLLFRDQTTPQLRLFDEALGWSRVLTGRYDVVSVPGLDVTKPNDVGVAAVVEHLQRALESAAGPSSRRR